MAPPIIHIQQRQLKRGMEESAPATAPPIKAGMNKFGLRLFILPPSLYFFYSIEISIRISRTILTAS
jgi:hypothetical protein